VGHLLGGGDGGAGSLGLGLVGFVVVEPAELGVVAGLLVLRLPDDAVPVVLVGEVVVHVLHCAVLFDVEPLVAVIENSEHTLLGRLVYEELGAGGGFNEDVLGEPPFGVFDQDPTVEPLALELVFLLEVGHVVAPDIGLLLVETGLV